MSSFSKYSTSYHESTSSDSENEIRNYSAFENLRANLKNTVKTRLASNLSRQTLNNSLRYFKKLRKQKNLQRASGVLPENKNTTLPYSLNSMKIKHSLPNSKNISVNKKKKYNSKKEKNYYSNSYSINLNNKFTAAVESSSSSDFSHLKLISTDKGINTSDTKESTRSKSDFDKKKTTINNSNYRSLSSNSSDFSQINIDSENFKNSGGNELNLQELLSDCSLSFVEKEYTNEDGQLYSTLNTNKPFIQMESKSPKTLSMNLSFGIDDNLPQKPTDVFINLPDLPNNETEDEHYQFMDTMETDEHEHVLNSGHCKLDKTKSFSDDVDLNEPVSNSVKSVEGNIASEPVCKYCNGSKQLKTDTQNSSHSTSDNTYKKKNKSKSLLINTTKKTEILRIKKSRETNKLKKHSSTNKSIIDDIGLKYDISEDMVELPNGALVPAFLSTLKPKNEKKLCICGITKLEIPPSWSESFHDILHKNIYKLWFKGYPEDVIFINCKHNDLFYRILVLRDDHHNYENVNKSMKDVEDFICLEYGISKRDTQPNKYSKYLAMLPNLKVIGYLEVKPIQKAYRFTNDKQPLEEIVPVKFGVSKIWVLIKYRNKFVDINLLDTFCKRENLQKEDLAFYLGGCQGDTFIREYTGNENILIYNEFPNSD